MYILRKKKYHGCEASSPAYPADRPFKPKKKITPRSIVEKRHLTTVPARRYAICFWRTNFTLRRNNSVGCQSLPDEERKRKESDRKIETIEANN